MKIVITDTKELYDALVLLKKERYKGNATALLYMAIVAENDSIYLLESNLDVTKKFRISGEVLSPGTVFVNLVDFDKIVRKLKAKGGSLTVSEGEESAGTLWTELNHDTTKLSFRLESIQKDTWAPIPSEIPEGHSLDTSAFARAISKALPYASTDESRNKLCGIYLTGSHMEATDGHRARRVSCPNADFGDVLLPLGAATVIEYAIKKLKPKASASTNPKGKAKKGVDSLTFENLGATPTKENSEPLGWIRYAKDSDRLVFHIGPLTVITTYDKYLEYPNLNQVISSQRKFPTPIQRQDLYEKVDLVSVFTSSATQNIRLSIFDNCLEIYASDAKGSLQEGKTTLDVENSHPSRKAGFNFNYLLHTLKEFDADVIEMDLIDSLSPVVLTEPEYPDEFAVIMPMRL